MDFVNLGLSHIKPPWCGMQERDDIPIVALWQILEMIPYLCLPFVRCNSKGLQFLYPFAYALILLLCYSHVLFVLLQSKVFQIGLEEGILYGFKIDVFIKSFIIR